MKIGQREIGNGQPCYIIAEAGTGYAGDSALERAAKLISLMFAAKDAGADAFKVQLFVPGEPLFCPMPGDESRWGRWGRTYLGRKPWADLKAACDEQGITFLASAFQPTAVQWLKELNVAAYKVASRAAATYPYDAVPGPFIISTGSQGWAEGAAKVEPGNSIYLHCVMNYPTPLAEARYPWCDCEQSTDDAGLSDHSGTIWPGLDAMARGAAVLEVHFAIDKADAGNDAQVCLSVDQLKLLCEARDAFAALRSPPR